MLDDISHAGFDEQVTAVFYLIEKSIRKPSELNATDFDRVRAVGVDDEAIVDTPYVSFVFDVVNRLANTFGFNWASADDTVKAARILNRVNYSFPSFLLAD